MCYETYAKYFVGNNPNGIFPILFLSFHRTLNRRVRELQVTPWDVFKWT